MEFKGQAESPDLWVTLVTCLQCFQTENAQGVETLISVINTYILLKFFFFTDFLVNDFLNEYLGSCKQCKKKKQNFFSSSQESESASI